MFGIGAIAGIAFRIIANMDDIMKMWAKIEPLIRNATGISGDVKDLINKIAPGVLDKALTPAVRSVGCWQQARTATPKSSRRSGCKSRSTN